jgi:hypothetical protein
MVNVILFLKVKSTTKIAGISYHCKNTCQLPGANPLENRKKPWETHFCQGICQGRARWERTLPQMFC